MKFYEAIIIDFFRAVIRCCLWCIDKLLQRDTNRDNLQPVRPARRHDGSDTVENDWILRCQQKAVSRLTIGLLTIERLIDDWGLLTINR